MVQGLVFGVVIGAVVAAICLLAIERAVRAHRAAAVTEKIREAERRAARAERMAEIGAMTGGLAHEIKNPLSTIGLNAQLVTEGLEDLATPDTAERDRLIRRVQGVNREVERLRAVLAEFLEYAGELRLERTACALNGIAEQLADFYMPQARSAGVAFDTALTSADTTAMLDANHVKQAALNILINATQAMADRDEPRCLTIATSREPVIDGEGPWVVLTIRDTGPGIPGDLVERVLTPYYTTKSGGSGLGLPLARRIADAHGGSLDIRPDEENAGASVSLRFPVTG